jgi:ubiquinone/menaquinone biosynthesis C-methylase UbiE/uncharacterized protein YbaR (Trm112 family)
VKARLIETLACPRCGQALRAWPEEAPGADREQGLLECGQGHLYPVVRGIPRLLPDALAEAHAELDAMPLPSDVRARLTAARADRDSDFESRFAPTRKSYSAEWGILRGSDRAWGLDVASRRRMFLECFGLGERDLAGRTVLDAGCGHGEVELALSGTGAEIFAMDLSTSVDDLRQRLPEAGAGHDVHLVQGSVHAPPFREGAFDLVHCAGVLHHTPDPREAFGSLARRVRPGGACYVEVASAERKNPLAHRVVTLARSVTVRLPHPVLHALCLLEAPLLWAFARAYNVAAGTQVYRPRTLRETELSLFDGFSPRYVHHHRTDEVAGWFAERGFTDVRKTFENKNGFGFTGILSRTA